jgi:hypothetical protein
LGTPPGFTEPVSGVFVLSKALPSPIIGREPKIGSVASEAASGFESHQRIGERLLESRTEDPVEKNKKKKTRKPSNFSTKYYVERCFQAP